MAQAGGLGLILSALVAYAAGSAARKAGPPPSPQRSKNTLTATQWLKRSQKSGQTLNFEGREVTINWMNGKTDSAVVRRIHSGNKERSEYLAPKDRVGRIFVSDSHTTKIYNPSTRTVTVHARNDTNAINLPLLLKNYRVTLEPKSRVQADRACRIVRLQPLSHGKPYYLYWLDAATGLKLKQEHFYSDGTPVGLTQFTEIKIGGTISPSRFKLPSGAKEVQVAKRKGGSPPKPALPARLPAGYQLQECREAPSTEGWHCLYSDGADIVSVFALKQAGKRPPKGEKVHLGSREGILRPQSHNWVVSWSQGQDRWALIGSLSRSLVLDIATVLASH
jgi:negative regulator of sigma E activity